MLTIIALYIIAPIIALGIGLYSLGVLAEKNYNK